MQELESLSYENERLRRLLGAASSLQVNYHFAELLRIDLDPFSHRVLINRGRNDGVLSGQAVIDSGGVMGQVESVLPGMAYVILISDPGHALPVQVARTGHRSIIYGSGDTSILRLSELPINIDLQPGDHLLTSGLGERFPAGYPVAEVMSVQREPGQTFAVAYARPLAALDRGREVLLLEPRLQKTATVPAEADGDTPGEETSP